MNLQKFIASQGVKESCLGELSFAGSLAVAVVETPRITLKATFHRGGSRVVPDEPGRSSVKTGFPGPASQFHVSALFVSPELWRRRRPRVPGSPSPPPHP